MTKEDYIGKMDYYIVEFAMKLKKHTFSQMISGKKIVVQETVDAFVNIMKHRKQRMTIQDI